MEEKWRERESYHYAVNNFVCHLNATWTPSEVANSAGAVAVLLIESHRRLFEYWAFNSLEVLLVCPKRMAVGVKPNERRNIPSGRNQ